MEQSDRVYVIAEAGVNHNGSVARAHDMIDAAAEAGADAVKFQTFVPDALAAASAAKAGYQKANTPDGDSQREMLRRLALDFASHHELLAHCRERNIDFLSSPFDAISADFLLDELQLPVIKLGSGELTNAPLLWKIAARDVRLILSTGMAVPDEVIEALGVCCLARDGIEPTSAQACRAAFDNERLRDHVTLLHCTTEYPCPIERVNLRAMDTLSELTGLGVGYSDHTQGIAVSIAAAARGARVLEKHFTLDRTLPGPDHMASLETDELAAMVSAVRAVSAALGSATKAPSTIELENAAVARKSLVAACAIRRGEPFSSENLTSKRPGNGRSPIEYWSLLGKAASRDYAADELIDEATGSGTAWKTVESP
ncbi:MAG: N-acetylneuraminate synthase [Gammaproteobacteria bacterium]|nr:N-acetylneuraminate synthase [Gammaproteobacteria bacterium]